MFEINGSSKDKKDRRKISESEWEAIKKVAKYKCVVCGKSEKEVGTLEKAHIKAHSKGGSLVVPMCPTCHRKYDSGKMTASELKKIGKS